MAMNYNDGTPFDYQAPCFHQGDDHASRLINLGHFSENQMMRTGYHRYIDGPHPRLHNWLMMRSVAVGWHLPGAALQSIDTPRQLVDNGDPGPSRIVRQGHNPNTPTKRAREHSIPSELGGGHTQPEAMRHIAGMVRNTPSQPKAVTDSLSSKGAFRQPDTDTQDTRPLYSQSIPPSRASTKRRRTGRSQPRLRYPPYTQSIIDFLDSQGEVNKSGIIDCDCGAEDGSGDLVRLVILTLIRLTNVCRFIARNVEAPTMLSAMDTLTVVTQRTSCVTCVFCIRKMVLTSMNYIWKCRICVSRDDFYIISWNTALVPLLSDLPNIPVSSQEPHASLQY